MTIWERVRATLGILITGGGVVASLTGVFLGMRSVMSIGGSCGSAGTGLPACPGHSAAFLMGGIWGGLIFTGLYVWQCMKHDVPSLVSLIWPGLFISLGYNFLDYGVSGGAGAGGLLVVGVVFVLMGGVPLIWALPHLWKVYVRGETDADKPWHVTATGNAVGTLKTLSRLVPTPRANMTESLEQLDQLHKSGALDDLEYAKAKDRVIREAQT
jgi:hypothetical protein